MMQVKGEKANYVIPLRAVFNSPKTKRAERTINAIKRFVKKHTRANEKNIKVSKEVNEFVWKQGKFSAPRKIDAILKKEAENIFVYLKNGKELAEKEKTTEKKETKEKKKKETGTKKEQAVEKKHEEKEGTKEEKKEIKETEEEKEKKKKLEEKRIKEKNYEKSEFRK